MLFNLPVQALKFTSYTPVFIGGSFEFYPFVNKTITLWWYGWAINTGNTTLQWFECY